MPFKRLIDTLRSERAQRCRSPQHYPPSLIYLPPGIYEYECPDCGASQIVAGADKPELCVP